MVTKDSRRQTRLTFSPLPSSSPALSRAAIVPDRAANVRFRQPLGCIGRNTQKASDIFATQLPTPVASSQPEIKGRKGQYKSSYRQASTSTSDSDLGTSDNDQYHTPSKTTKRKRGTPATPNTPRSNNFFAGSVQRQQQKGAPRSDELSPNNLNDGDVVHFPSIKRRKSQPTIIVSSEDEEVTPSVVRSSAFVSRSTHKKPVVASPESSEVQEDSDAESNAEGDAFRNSWKRKKRPISPDSMAADSDDPPIVSPRHTRRLKQFSHESEGRVKDSIPKPIKKRRSGRAQILSDDELSDESQVTPIRDRRLRQDKKATGAQSADMSDGSSAEDIREDINNLGDLKVIKQRTRGKPAASDRNARQVQLQKLQRRRARRNLSSEPDGSNDDQPIHKGRRKEPVSVSSDDGDDDIVVSDHSNADRSIQSIIDEDEEVNDFVISDDSDTLLGAPADLLNEIPLEFTRHAHKKPIEYFQHAVEWMVHNKLNPAFSRHDQIYDIAVRKLDDEIRGLMGSKFMSSVWTPNFLTTLKSRPDLYTLEVPTMFDHKCGACNRSKHPPTQSLSFQGKPYHTFSLEALSDDSDSGSESSPPTSPHSTSTTSTERVFHVGRVCSANASTAHALHHWRYHLNQYILQWLSMQGHTSAAKIVEREKWSQRKKEAFANKIVDGMVEGGEMKRLYREFKENLSAARDARTDGLERRF